MATKLQLYDISVMHNLTCRLATFYSRSRKGRWCKGETSGHFIQVLNVYLDCDRDSIIYQGEPIGPACHTVCNYVVVFNGSQDVADHIAFPCVGHRPASNLEGPADDEAGIDTSWRQADNAHVASSQDIQAYLMHRSLTLKMWL